MRVPIFQVDAFTNRRFSGNPAAVMLLPDFPADTGMQAIAAENNLAETAFLVPQNGDYRLRWFTPVLEVPLCGHATLASAAVVMERLEPGKQCVVFHTASGPLTVTRMGKAYRMNFPARPSELIPTPAAITEALGVAPMEVMVNEFNFMARMENERVLRQLSPDMLKLAHVGRPGVIVTAAGESEYDFVSRYFAPAKGIPEDPVTGAAHCMLAPYWAEKTGKTEFRAFQASTRGGEVICRLTNGRIELQGECVFFFSGEADI